MRLNCVGVLFVFLSLLQSPVAIAKKTAADALLGFHDNSIDPPLVPLLRAARASIDIEIYEMEDQDVRMALRAALARGVVVRVVQEPAALGEHCDIFGGSAVRPAAACQDMQKLVGEVRAGGGAYVPFNKRALCGNGSRCFQHGKMVLIDGQYALISTGNFNSTNLCSLDQNPDTCNRDYTVVTSDAERVLFLRRVFEGDLAGETYDVASMMSASVARKLTISPISLPAILELIATAQKSIQIENQYLNEPRLNAALVAAASRGVAVSVTVSSVCSFAEPTLRKREEITAIFSTFDSVNISSRFFTRRTLIRGKPGYLHAKAIVVDDRRAWVGSMNGSTMSATSNREFGIFFDDAASVQALALQMTSDHDDREAETWGESLRCRNDRGTGTRRYDLDDVAFIDGIDGLPREIDDESRGALDRLDESSH